LITNYIQLQNIDGADDRSIPDSITITITAEFDSNDSITKQVVIKKLKSGKDGEFPTTYEVVPSKKIINLGSSAYLTNYTLEVKLYEIKESKTKVTITN
jgi:hypothetical protein